MAELEVQSVSVMRGKLRVVSDIGFSASAGEVLAVLGPNGAGKSTLLRAVAGLLPSTGRVRLAGAELSSLTPNERARRLAFVPQQSSLRSALPVREVVAQGRYMHRGAFGGSSANDRAAVEQALETCDAMLFAERSFTTLSFGEQRRVLIARALATGARILCLDEPTASLDVHHVLRLHALLRRLASDGYTIVAVLHPLDDALRHADRALLMAAGRSLCIGPVAEVISESRVREIYGVEMQHATALGFSLAAKAGAVTP